MTWCAGRINGRRICFVLGLPSGRVQDHYIGLVCRAEFRVETEGSRCMYKAGEQCVLDCLMAIGRASRSALA